MRGFGLNAASKILASHDAKKWPVYNSPVETVLEYFEYRAPVGVSVGEKYRAFAELMSQFRKESDAPDMIALDCFFYDFWDRRLDRQ